MSVTQVTVQLQRRGWKVDCVAWYPWMHDEYHLFGQYLGFDSCAIFYIGGAVQVKMPRNLGSGPRWFPQAGLLNSTTMRERGNWSCPV